MTDSFETSEMSQAIYQMPARDLNDDSFIYVYMNHRIIYK